MTLYNSLNTRKHILGTGFNSFTFILFIMFLIAIGWMALNNVPAGNTYIILIVIALFSFVAAMIVKKDYQVYLPIEKSETRAMLGFWLGVGLVLILALSKALGFTGFSFIQQHFGLVFSGSQSGVLQQSFAALSALNDPFFSWFSVVFGGGVGEEIAFMLLYISGLVLGMWILRTLNRDFGASLNKIIHIIVASGFVGIFFAFLHKLNPLYDTSGEFFTAFFFRIIMTAISFYFLGISFAIGFHAAINATFLGFDALVNAFFSSIGGLLVFATLALSLIGLILAFKKTDEAREAFFDLKLQGDE